MSNLSCIIEIKGKSLELNPKVIIGYISLLFLSLSFVGIQIHPSPSNKPAKYELKF